MNKRLSNKINLHILKNAHFSMYSTQKVQKHFKEFSKREPLHKDATQQFFDVKNKSYLLLVIFIFFFFLVALILFRKFQFHVNSRFFNKKGSCFIKDENISWNIKFIYADGRKENMIPKFHAFKKFIIW